MVNCLLESHHLILSLGLLCNWCEWKLLTPAYQEYYHPCLDLGNTHRHKLQFFFVQLWRSSPDQFGNTNRLMKRHMAHPMTIILKRSRAKGSTSSWRKLETVIRLKVMHGVPNVRNREDNISSPC